MQHSIETIWDQLRKLGYKPNARNPYEYYGLPNGKNSEYKERKKIIDCLLLQLYLGLSGDVSDYVVQELENKLDDAIYLT